MLTLFLGLSAINLEGALLCLGEDGHIAMELVGACNGSDFNSQVAEAGGDACGPCKDVQFQSSPVFTNRTFHYTDTQTLSLVSLARIAPSLVLEEHYNSPISLPEKPPYKTLASLQSVVLLI
ncbi:MAG: hypothetical protein AB1632_07145 [Nitrospirota bacterium]